MVLNRAIYVFTVVTVIYTPLGFMAVSSLIRYYHNFITYDILDILGFTHRKWLE